MIAPVDTSKLHIGHLARLQLLGVFATGVLVLAEVWLLWYAEDIREKPVLRVASEKLDGVSVRALWVGTLIMLIVAYVLGLLLRQLTVWIIDKSQRWQLTRWIMTRPLKGLARRRDWNRLVNTYLKYGSPFPRDALDRLIEVSGGGQPNTDQEEKEPWSQDRALNRLAAILGSPDPDRQDGASRLLVYSKLWLRIRQPLLAVEHIEAEITFLRGLLAPAMLGIAVSVRLLIPGPRGPALAAVVGVVLFGMVIFMYVHIQNLRAKEPLEAARNYLLVNAYGREGSEEG